MKSRQINTIYILIILHLLLLLLIYLWSFAQFAWWVSIWANISRLGVVLSNFIDQVALPGGIVLEQWGNLSSILGEFYSTSTRLLPSASTIFSIKTWINGGKVPVKLGLVSVYGWTRVFSFWPTRLIAYFAEFKQLGVVKTTNFLGKSLGFFYSQLVFGKLPNSVSSLHPLFKVTGMQYVLVVSGFHLSLLARTIASSLHKLLPTKQVAVVIIVVVVCYNLLIGFSASLLRAIFMLVAATIGRFLLLRQHRSSYAFLWLIPIISLLHPLILRSISFQLSVVATAGIIYLLPLLASRDNIIAALERGEFAKGRIVGSTWQKYLSLAKNSCLVSCSVNLALLPLLLYYFAEVHLISIVISSIFFWLAPLIITMAWIVVVAASVGSGVILSPLKLIATWVAGGVAQILAVFAKWPLTIKANDLPLVVVIGWWLCLLFGVLLHSRIKQRRQQYHRLAL